MKHKKVVFPYHIYMCDLPSVGGSVQEGLRPVCVVGNELSCIHSPAVTVVPITSKAKTNIPTHTNLYKRKYSFLSYEENTVLCEQILTVPKEELRFIGVLEEKDIQEIKKCLKIQLDLD